MVSVLEENYWRLREWIDAECEPPLYIAFGKSDEYDLRLTADLIRYALKGQLKESKEPKEEGVE